MALDAVAYPHSGFAIPFSLGSGHFVSLSTVLYVQANDPAATPAPDEIINNYLRLRDFPADWPCSYVVAANCPAIPTRKHELPPGLKRVAQGEQPRNMKFTVEPDPRFSCIISAEKHFCETTNRLFESALDKEKLPLQSVRTSVENYGRVMRVVNGVGSWK
ncbi:hypothetical protein U5A82_20800 [Sphingobium sp. CR2-8]|uniref:hypothetical protein n=1 Tax=Sphingobium sp. CR2-8 TaxID=1306534 RepID=UPI002DBBD506|nr:hypothetical protein [Sphingobium sp. CR2-8]MEC3912818.1 hypothetical protein [Sphingobium sp. CR2-8]